MLRFPPLQWAALTCALVACLVWINLPTPIVSNANGAVIAELIPSADTFVTSSNANGNFGGAGALAVSAAGAQKGAFESWMKFDMAAAKTQFDTAYGVGNWSLDAVTLTMTRTSPNNNALFNADALPVSLKVQWIHDDSWSEGTGTPNVVGTIGLNYTSSQATLTGNDVLVSSITTTQVPNNATKEVFNLGLNSNFVSDIKNGQLVTLRLFSDEGAGSILFNSRNFGTASNRPLLSVSAVAVPEPNFAIAVAAVTISCMFRKRCPRK